MTLDLFPSAHSDSPKLVWLRQHGVVIVKNAKGRYEAIINDDLWGAGSDEEEAIADLCLNTGLPHYRTPIQ